MQTLLEILVKGKDSFPQIDLAMNSGGGYVPENELMRAIILRVIEDLKTPGENHDDAMLYMFEDEDDDGEDGNEYVFSFRGICRHLGFDHIAARESILQSIADGRRISTRRRAA